MDNSYLTFPIITSIVFFFNGRRGNWKRALIIIMICYACIILAFQNFSTMANISSKLVDSKITNTQQVALGLGVSLIAFFIGLLILYKILWNPENSSDQTESSSGNKLWQSIIFSIFGWVFGVLLVVCYLHFSDNELHLFSGGNTSFVQDVFKFTIQLTIRLVSPWLIHAPPTFILR